MKIKSETKINLQDKASSNSVKNGDRLTNESLGMKKKDFASILGSITQAKDVREKEREFDSNKSESWKNEKDNSCQESHSVKDAQSDDSYSDKDSKDQSDKNKEGMTGTLLVGQHASTNRISDEVFGASFALRTADLERLVTCVHSQVNATGQKEVTLELARSILDGLRIKFSHDTTGKLNLELIASSENIKSLLDARSDELTQMLRSRNIEISSLKTTIGSGFAGMNNGSNREKELWGEKLEISGTQSSSAVFEQHGPDDATSSVDDTNIYRA
jgi:hypothetical protein